MSLHLRWFVMKALQSHIVDQKLNNALTFYQLNLEKVKGKILEVGDSHLFFLPSLIANGHRIEGLLASEEGKANYQQKIDSLNQDVRLYQAELTEFKLQPKYHAIILPFGVALTIGERMHTIKLLKNVYDHLQEQGTIIVDLFLQDEYSLSQKSDLVIEDKDHLYVGESKLMKIDKFEQTMTYLLSLEKWSQGKMIAKEHMVQDFVWFGIKEFKLVLERIGFLNVEIVKDYSPDMKNYSDHSTFTLIAQK